MKSINLIMVAMLFADTSPLSVANGQTTEPTVAMEAEVQVGAPPLPNPSEADAPQPTESRPRAPREDRGEPEASAGERRRFPIPGQPARDLPEIGVPASDETELPSLLEFIPHRGPKGALAAEAIYTGETFALANGGLLNQRASSYRGNLDLVLTLDLDVAAGLKGARLFVYGQTLHGNPLSNRAVGDLQLFSNLDSTISETERPEFTTIAEYWYEQMWGDSQMRTKLGKQDANADFAYSDVAGDFVHSSFGLPPTIPLPTFPSQALGAAAFLSASENIVISGGIYDGTLPSGPQGVRWGFDTLGHNGFMLLSQLEWKGQLGLNGQLPSTVRAGLWHHTSDDLWTDFNAVPNVKSSNSGGWLIGDQMLFKEEYGTDDTQGLAAFAMYSWTHEDRNVVGSSLATGLVYNGLLPNRDSDLLGLGVAIAGFSADYYQAERLAGNLLSPNEAATELFYKCRLTSCVTLQPEIQYISNPSGIYSDAFLYGLRFESVL